MQENGATLAPQLLQERNGVLQHESEVRVLVQAFIVDQLDLDQLNPWQVRVTNPAKGHDRVHARGSARSALIAPSHRFSSYG